MAARITHEDDDVLLVMMHAAEPEAAAELAAIIAKEVRGLKLHHPHSNKERFVTVSANHAVASAKGGPAESQAFLASLLAE